MNPHSHPPCSKEPSSERESGLSKIHQQVGARAQHWDPELLPVYAVLSRAPWSHCGKTTSGFLLVFGIFCVQGIVLSTFQE